MKTTDIVLLQQLIGITVQCWVVLQLVW